MMAGKQSPYSGMSPVKLALLAQNAFEETSALVRAMPIAIVGMACRFPGGSNSPEQYWDLLMRRGDAITDAPAERWGSGWYDPDPAATGKSLTKRGGFLTAIDGFDAEYFGVLPREAVQMDPQQRVFLEVAMEALDDAGVTRDMLRGARAGVFVASYNNEYATAQYGDPDRIDARTLTGTLHSVLANRLSHFLDLRGPSLSIDTACSSSLVAVHLACQSLLARETDAAIAGGVSLMATPDVMIALSKVGFMAPDGRCKTFDASADGFGRSEGCGVIVLKRLSDAIADDDRVLAVIRGSAVNQDGHSTVLAAPNGLAQRAVIRDALAAAQIEPERVSYIEAHGTGTPLGDPIEIEAIAETVGVPSNTGACFVGAAKSNIGHMEAAAGIGGLIKVVLSLRNECIPGQALFETLNPHISLEGTRLRIPKEPVPWPATGVPRIAGTSSFGVGGTNAHVILEEAPRLGGAAETVEARARLLPLSAQSDAALDELASRWREFLPGSDASLASLCFTAGVRRSHLDVRLAMCGDTREDFTRALESFVRGEASANVASGRVDPVAGPRVAFVFSGQGPQWAGMGRELLASEPVFREAIEACDDVLRRVAGWSLIDALMEPEERSRLHDTEVAQPALCALQIALAALWNAWGVRPDAVVGHSVGEIAALHAAGALTLDEAIRVACHRGKVMQRATGGGKMASVALTPDEARPLVQAFGTRLSIGAINAPRSLVLSGEAGAVDEVLATLTARGVDARMLPVNYAFHSAQMLPLRQEFESLVGTVRVSAPTASVYSTVRGRTAVSGEFDTAYFGSNISEPVRFAAAIDAAMADGVTTFVEVGPHPVLAQYVAAIATGRGADVAILPSLRRHNPERMTLLRAAGALYCQGILLDHGAINGPGEVTDLPSYPWQHRKFWLPARLAARNGATPVHPLLGSRVSIAGMDVTVFDVRWIHGLPGSLEQHEIGGRPFMPGAAMAEMLRAATQEASGGARVALTAFEIERPFELAPAGETTAWQISVREENGKSHAELFERVPGDASPDAWRRVAHAYASTSDEAHDIIATDATAAVSESADALYARYAEAGVAFGPVFRTIDALERGEGWARARLRMIDDHADDTAQFGIHPALLDGAFQTCVAAMLGMHDSGRGALMVPLGFDRFELLSPAGSHLTAVARVREGARTSITADIDLLNDAGLPVGFVRGLRLVPGEAMSRRAPAQLDDWLYEVTWQESPSTAVRERADGAWLLAGNDSRLLDEIAAALQRLGGECTVVRFGAAYDADGARYTIDAASPGDFERVIAAWKGPHRGVVHLSGAEDGDGDAATADLHASGSLLHLVQVLARTKGVAGTPVFAVTHSAQHVVAGDRPRIAPAGAAGFASVVAVEHPEFSIRTLDVDDTAGVADAVAAEITARHERREFRTAFRRGQRYVARLIRYRGVANQEQAAHGDRRLVAARPGTLDGLETVQIERRSPGDTEVRVGIAAAGLNFRDVLLALGMYPGTGVPLGSECAGIVLETGKRVTRFRPGDRVLGYAFDTLATSVMVDEWRLVGIPDALGFEEAATVPAAFLTAKLALHRVAPLEPGHRVLIHAGAGGVGMAAIQLAQQRGAEVIATAGSEAKRALLRTMGVRHVLDSRTTAFADEIQTLTNGEGVHVVLNSLSGDFVQAGLSCVATGGAFIELGKRDALSADDVARIRPDVMYRRIDLSEAAEADRELVPAMLDELLRALAAREITPLPLTTFDLADATDAFRYMAQARHTGKVVIRMPRETSPGGFVVQPSARYLVTGGLGAIGIDTARWLVARGARNLVLCGRNAPGAHARAAIAAMETAGATVRVVQADASDESAMRRLIGELDTPAGRLRGIFHSAGIVDDGVIVQQNWSRCLAVLRSKAHSARVLDRLSRSLELDVFVLYSAAGLQLGAPGQCAYAAANAELDAIAFARREAGLPALSIAWGAWSGAGMVAELAARGDNIWQKRGLMPIAPTEAFLRLDRLLRDGAAHALAMAIDWPRFRSTRPEGVDASFLAAIEREPNVTRASRSAASPSVISKLQALPEAQRPAALADYLKGQVLHAIGRDASTGIDPRRPLREIGLDSLMAVELRNALGRAFGKVFPAALLFDYPTLDALTEFLLRALNAGDGRAAAAPSAVATDRAAPVAGLSDEEAEAALIAELNSLSAERRR